MRRLILTLGVMAAAGLVLGCGSGGDEATSATPLSKAEFIRQARAICSKNAEQLEAEFETVREELPDDPAEAEKKLDEGVEEIVAPAVRRRAEELESLAPPVDDEEQVSRIIESLLEASSAYEEEGMKALLGPAAAEARKIATAYDIRVCGIVGS